MIALGRTPQSVCRCPLPHACLREHMAGCRTRCRPSLVHACARLPVATGRRRLALLRCGARCACASLSSRLATCLLRGGGRRLCQRHDATRSTRWVRARAAHSCSLLLPTVATDAEALSTEAGVFRSGLAPRAPDATILILLTGLASSTSCSPADSSTSTEHPDELAASVAQVRAPHRPSAGSPPLLITPPLAHARAALPKDERQPLNNPEPSLPSREHADARFLMGREHALPPHQAARALYLPTSPHISPHLPTSRAPHQAARTHPFRGASKPARQSRAHLSPRSPCP